MKELIKVKEEKEGKKEIDIEEKNKLKKMKKDLEEMKSKIKIIEEKKEEEENKKEVIGGEIFLESKNIFEMNKKIISNNLKNNNIRRMKIINDIIKILEKKGDKNIWEEIFNKEKNRKEINGINWKVVKDEEKKEYQIKLEKLIEEKYVKFNKRDPFRKRKGYMNSNGRKSKIRIKYLKDKEIINCKIKYNEEIDKENNLEIIEDKNGNLIIYDMLKDKEIKKLCKYCLDENHDSLNCMNTMNYIGILNVKWNGITKNNICPFCGWMHSMKSKNDLKKLENCKIFAKMLGYAWLCSIDIYSTNEKQKLDWNKDKCINLLKKLIKKHNDIIEYLIKKMDKDITWMNEENEDISKSNIWINKNKITYKILNECVKKISFFYVLKNYKEKRNNNNFSIKKEKIKSNKLGITNNKKDIETCIFELLKNYMKELNLRISLDWGNKFRYFYRNNKNFMEIKEKELNIIYWNIINLGITNKIMKIIEKKGERIKLKFYLKKENLITKLYNRYLAINMMKNEKINRLNIKKCIMDNLIEDKGEYINANEKLYNSFKDTIRKQIEDLENEKIKEVIKKNDERMRSRHLQDADRYNDAYKDLLESEDSESNSNENKDNKEEENNEVENKKDEDKEGEEEEEDEEKEEEEDNKEKRKSLKRKEEKKEKDKKSSSTMSLLMKDVKIEDAKDKKEKEKEKEEKKEEKEEEKIDENEDMNNFA